MIWRGQFRPVDLEMLARAAKEVGANVMLTANVGEEQAELGMTVRREDGSRLHVSADTVGRLS